MLFPIGCIGLIYPLLQVVDCQPKTFSDKAVRYLLRQIASILEGSDKSRYTHPAGDTTTRDYLYTFEVLKAGEECLWPDLNLLVHWSYMTLICTMYLHVSGLHKCTWSMKYSVITCMCAWLLGWFLQSVLYCVNHIVLLLKTEHDYDPKIYIAWCWPFTNQWRTDASWPLWTLHKLMGIYMGGLILGVILQYMISASFSCFLWSVKG